MNIKRAKYHEISKIQAFIHDNYRNNHILSESKALFVHEYLNTGNNLDSNQNINFYYSEKNKK